MGDENTDPGLAAVAELMDLEEDELGISPTEDDRPEPDTAGEPVSKGKSDDLEEFAPEGSPDAERIERDKAVEAEATEPAPEAAAPAEEPETVESLRAKLAETQEQLQRQNDGFLRTITSLRQRNQDAQAQPPVQPQPQAPAPEAKPIPVETFFDDDGNLKGQVSPEAIAQAIAQAQTQTPPPPAQPEAPQVNPAAQLFGIQQSLSMQHQDKAPQVTRIFEAGARLDTLLTQKLMEVGAQRMPSSVEEARQVALGMGIDKALAQQYPELALEGRRFDDLLEGWMSLNPRSFEYLLQDVQVPDSAPVPPVHNRVADDGKPPEPRPRPLAQRGRSPDVAPKSSGEARLQEIEDNYPNLLTAPQSVQKEYQRLVARHVGSPRLTGSER